MENTQIVTTAPAASSATEVLASSSITTPVVKAKRIRKPAVKAAPVVVAVAAPVVKAKRKPVAVKAKAKAKPVAKARPALSPRQYTKRVHSFTGPEKTQIVRSIKAVGLVHTAAAFNTSYQTVRALAEARGIEIALGRRFGT